MHNISITACTVDFGQYKGKNKAYCICNEIKWKTLEKTKGPIKNLQPKETANIGYIRHMMKTNNTRVTTQKTTKVSNTDPPTIEDYDVIII